METLTDILAMGGYAAFVWPAYAVTGAAMLGMAFLSLRELRRAQARIRALQGVADGDEA